MKLFPTGILSLVLGMVFFQGPIWADDAPDVPLMCPIIQLGGPMGVEELEQEEWTFTASIHGTTEDVLKTLTYQWMVSAGEIREGQGTPIMKIARPPQGKGVTVTVKINSPYVSDTTCPVIHSLSAYNFAPYQTDLHIQAP